MKQDFLTTSEEMRGGEDEGTEGRKGGKTEEEKKAGCGKKEWSEERRTLSQ